MLVGCITLPCNDLFIWGKQSAPAGLCPDCLTAWRVGTAGTCWIRCEGGAGLGLLSFPGKQACWVRAMCQDEGFSQAASGGAEGFMGVISSVLTTTLGMYRTQIPTLWMKKWGAEKLCDMPVSPGQAMKGFSYLMGQSSFCPFAPEPGLNTYGLTLPLAPMCEVQVIYPHFRKRLEAYRGERTD